MRNIKFRAWSTPYSKYEKGHMWEWCHMHSEILEYIEEMRTNKELRKQLIIMQYIGLKDKNGVECYDGDIIKSLGELFVASYDEEKASFVFWHKGIYGSKEITPVHVRGGKVIGNIYENYKLLK